MTLHRRIINFLGLRRSMAALLAMVILVGMGEKLGERFLPIYILALGGGAYVIGLLNGLDNLLSALYSFPGGYLSDRLGYKAALAVFNLVAMVGYVIVIVFPTWQAVILGAFFFISWDALSLPATMSLVANVLPKDKRTMGVSLHSLIRRIPMALGPVVGGLLIGRFGERDGVRAAFGVALAAGARRAGAPAALIEDGPRKTHAEGNPLRLARFMTPALRNLLVSDILVRFCEQIPYAFAVVYCMKNVGVSAVQFGMLTTIEMIVAMLIYIPVAYLADRGGKKPFVVITFFNFTLFPLVPADLAQLRHAGRRLHRARAEGVRRADAQGADHGSGAGGQEGGHVRALLPDPGRDRVAGRVRRRVAVDNLAADQLPGRGGIRPGWDAVLIFFGRELPGQGLGIRYWALHDCPKIPNSQSLIPNTSR